MWGPPLGVLSLVLRINSVFTSFTASTVYVLVETSGSLVYLGHEEFHPKVSRRRATDPLGSRCA